MHKLEITLKQHTPIIHFQHDQDGATLRASEVKPKLDRFLLTKLGKNYERLVEDFFDLRENASSGFFENKIGLQLGFFATKQLQIMQSSKSIEVISREENGYYQIGKLIAQNLGLTNEGGDNSSLRYKMHLTAIGDVFEKKIKIINADKVALIAPIVRLSIFTSLGDNLLDKVFNCEIDSYLDEFFVISNFGFRQSRGYGSFSVLRQNVDGKYYIISEDDINKYLSDSFSRVISSDEITSNNFSVNISHFYGLTRFQKKELKEAKIKYPHNIYLQARFDENLYKNNNKEFIEIITKKINNIKRNISEEFKQKSAIGEQIIKNINSKFSDITNEILYAYFDYLFEYLEKLSHTYKSGDSGKVRGLPHCKSKLRDNMGLQLQGNNDIVYWEKRYIKQKLSPHLPISVGNISLDLKSERTDSDRTIDVGNPEYFFIRPLLGLVENFEFQTTNSSFKFIVTVSSAEENDIDKADRFSSILFFKVINNRIYVCLKDVAYLRKILGKTFSLQMKIKKDRNFLDNSYDINLGTISTPLLTNDQIDELYIDIINFFQNKFNQ